MPKEVAPGETLLGTMLNSFHHTATLLERNTLRYQPVWRTLALKRNEWDHLSSYNRKPNENSDSWSHDFFSGLPLDLHNAMLLLADKAVFLF